jgi:hypothetical protein
MVKSCPDGPQRRFRSASIKDIVGPRRQVRLVPQGAMASHQIKRKRLPTSATAAMALAALAASAFIGWGLSSEAALL